MQKKQTRKSPTNSIRQYIHINITHRCVWTYKSQKLLSHWHQWQPMIWSYRFTSWNDRFVRHHGNWIREVCETQTLVIDCIWPSFTRQLISLLAAMQVHGRLHIINDLLFCNSQCVCTNLDDSTYSSYHCLGKFCTRVLLIWRFETRLVQGLCVVRFVKEVLQDHLNSMEQ